MEQLYLIVAVTEKPRPGPFLLYVDNWGNLQWMCSGIATCIRVKMQKVCFKFPPPDAKQHYYYTLSVSLCLWTLSAIQPTTVWVLWLWVISAACIRRPLSKGAMYTVPLSELTALRSHQNRGPTSCHTWLSSAWHQLLGLDLTESQVHGTFISPSTDLRML